MAKDVKVQREYDVQRRAQQATRPLYGTVRWKALRAEQLRTEPLCRRCASQGRVTPATVCHHVTPHRGDVARFWAGPFASSCADCHDIDEQRIESGGRPRQVLDAEGWPT